MLGLGSNLLVRDRGFSGVVIKLTQLNQLSIDKGVIQVDALMHHRHCLEWHLKIQRHSSPEIRKIERVLPVLHLHPLE
jgi:UDP-N-acetylenolpyruvoylglucosamine reductase